MISHRNWIKRNGKRKANNINSWSNWRDNHILSKFSPWNWYHWWNTNGIVCIPIFVFFLLLFSNTRQEIRRHYWQRSNCVILKLKNMSSRIPNYKSNKNIFFRCFSFLSLNLNRNSVCFSKQMLFWSCFIQFQLDFSHFHVHLWIISICLRLVKNCTHDYEYHNQTISHLQ